MDPASLPNVLNETGQDGNFDHQKRSEEGPAMKVAALGIELAKSIFVSTAPDGRGTVVLRKQITRRQLLLFRARLSPCLVGMEACAGAHYWAREIEQVGHTVRFISPHFVAWYRKSNKNDGNDADGICEAVGRLSNCAALYGCPNLIESRLTRDSQDDYLHTIASLHVQLAGLPRPRWRMFPPDNTSPAALYSPFQ